MYREKETCESLKNCVDEKKKKTFMYTAVTCGSIDRDLLKITPIFLAIVEQSTVSVVIPRLFNVGRGR